MVGEIPGTGDDVPVTASFRTPAATRLYDGLTDRLDRADLDRVELTGVPGPRLRVDVVQAGQTFFWIGFVAADEADFEIARAGRAAMRSFPWTEPFRPGLERNRASLPVLCRWQRAYVEDTAALCVTLLDKHFRVDLESVRIGLVGEREAGTPKPQKVWLREVTAWYMRAQADSRSGPASGRTATGDTLG